MTSTRKKLKDVVQVLDPTTQAIPFTGYGQELQADPTIAGVNERTDSIRYYSQYHRQVYFNTGGVVVPLFTVPNDQILMISTVHVQCSTNGGNANIAFNINDPSGNAQWTMRVDCHGNANAGDSNSAAQHFPVPIIVPSGWTISTTGGASGGNITCSVTGWLEEGKNF